MQIIILRIIFSCKILDKFLDESMSRLKVNDAVVQLFPVSTFDQQDIVQQFLVQRLQHDVVQVHVEATVSVQGDEPDVIGEMGRPESTVSPLAILVPLLQR